MNFLAHLLLAGDQPESIVGAILADFVRGRQGEQYSACIRAGMRLHVRIDSFTDAHPVVALSKSRMRPPYRRFAGVLTDVFYDHFLARNWETYSPAIPLEEFARQSYAILWDAREILPERLRRMLPRMIEQDWLTSYRNAESIDGVLQGLARRVKRETPLPHAIFVLREHDAELESDFTEFFPQLVQFVTNQPRPRDNGSG
jgi:acyl carrier protein phosphodiesterase